MKHLSISSLKAPGAAAAAFALLCISLACANLLENDKQRQEARSTGKYHVRIISDAEKEKTEGSCKFVRSINADDDPVRRPMDAELRDYLRAEAVYLGADTIYIDGRTAEAYICGPGPLNPDGTRKAPEPAHK